jgi:7,8-dihydro-6-hydroxymethylpterin-pyrophosphokinase
VSYGERKISEPGLEIPHPRLAERAFVLVPMNEIAPEIRDSRSGKTMTQLLNSLRDKDKSDTNAVVSLENRSWRAGVNGGVAHSDQK